MIKSFSRRILGAIDRRRWHRNAPIYLISAAGQPNFGDEFITRSWLDWLAEHQPRREVWLDCIEPGRAAHLFRDTHPGLRTTNTLWQVAHTNARQNVEEAAERVENLVLGLGSPKMDFGLRDLRTMGSLHLLGGGYVNSIWSNNLSIVAAMTAVRRRFGVRIYATGQGLLPHDGDSLQWMKGQLRQFDYAEARDTGSARVFDIRKGSDDAFLAFANRRAIYAPREIAKEAMLLVQGDMPDSSNVDDLAVLVDEFVQSAKGAQHVGFVEGIPPEDSKFAQRYVEAGATFLPFMRIWDEGFPAFPGQEWLTSRFHFHLLAAAAGARGSVVSIRPGYYDVKHELLLELGTGWQMQGSDDALREGTLNVDFPARARRLGVEKSQLAGRLYRR
jgi:hypothetical protein